MKKAIAALSAVGLALGMATALGATAATATVHSHAIAITVSKTIGLSPTAPTKLTVKLTGATKGDLIEAGICNEDASQVNPLTSPGAACTNPGATLTTAGAAGTHTWKITLTPGLQGTDGLSGCPVTTGQYGLGIQCLVAAADITAGTTADVTLYFKPGKAKVKYSAKKKTATITVPNGFEVIGLVGATQQTLTGPCQPFSGTVAGGAAPWTAAPLCDDADNIPVGLGGAQAAGIGFAAGEAVVPVINGIAAPTLYALASADAPVPVSNPGGVTITIPYADLNAAGVANNVTLVGSGYTGGANASGVTVSVTVTVP